MFAGDIDVSDELKLRKFGQIDRQQFDGMQGLLFGDLTEVLSNSLGRPEFRRIFNLNGSFELLIGLPMGDPINPMTAGFLAPIESAQFSPSGKLINYTEDVEMSEGLLKHLMYKKD